jgi:hypothetical protein
MSPLHRSPEDSPLYGGSSILLVSQGSQETYQGHGVSGVWLIMMLFVSRSPVIIAAAEVSTKAGEAFRDPVSHLCCLYDKWLLLDLDLPALSKGARVDGHICSSGSTDYTTSFNSFIPMSRDTYKNQFSLQLCSVTMDVKTMHYCVRYTIREFLWEPWHKSHCRGQNSCPAEGSQGSPSSEFQFRSRGCQEQSKNSLGSVVFYTLHHLIYHQTCFFLHFAICSLTLSMWQ